MPKGASVMTVLASETLAAQNRSDFNETVFVIYALSSLHPRANRAKLMSDN